MPGKQRLKALQSVVSGKVERIEENNMKIKDIQLIRAGKYLFVKVETDDGITGIGEAGAWSYLDATVEAINRLKAGVIGKNCFEIEHLWQMMYRSTYFRGSVIMSAISAIDIALWDIKGKALGVPVYELLGGKCRNQVRCYAPVFEFLPEKMAQGCIDLKNSGFTAARLLLNPPLGGVSFDFEECIYSNRVASAIEKVRQCREAVGDKFDLCLEVHRSMNPAEATAFAEGVAKYHPMFIEDPIPPDNYPVLADISKKTTVPIATGERFINIQEFDLLLSKDSVCYIRPDICLMGGLTAAKKVAGMAEAHYVGVIPHNPLGPVSTAVCLQLDACIPNFSIQEFPSFYRKENESEMMVEPFKIENGCIKISDKPGIGVELIPDIEEKFPPIDSRQRIFGKTAFDGSVRDT